MVTDWLSKQRKEGAELHIATVTVAELLYGVELLPQGKRRAALLAGCETMFTRVFDRHIISFDEEAARAFSKIAAARRTQGRPIAEFDAQVAAIARSRGATLATRNTDDFEGCGVRLVNPWLEGK
jgi:predicted nucleic acid-binding protein